MIEVKHGGINENRGKDCNRARIKETGGAILLTASVRGDEEGT